MFVPLTDRLYEDPHPLKHYLSWIPGLSNRVLLVTLSRIEKCLEIVPRVNDMNVMKLSAIVVVELAVGRRFWAYILVAA